MKGYPWFPFYAADFAGSRTVRLMPPEQVGVYILLLCFQWEDGPLPDDLDALAALANSDVNAVRAVLEKCFEHTEDGWANERLECVREEQVEKRQKKVRAGKASGKARRRNKIEHRSNTVRTPLEQSESEVEVETEVDNNRDANAPPSKPGKPVIDASAPVSAMHDAFTDVLGGSPPHPNLTRKRRQKYEALWTEHLAGLDDWEAVWRALLDSITDSDHHMSQRSYQMPESFLLNEERRDRWVQQAAARLNGGAGLTDADRRLLRKRQELEGVKLS